MMTRESMGGSSVIRTGLVVLLLLVATAAPAQAYVGPGLGAGMVASVLGLLGGLAMLLFGAVWYPLKKLGKAIRAIFTK